MAGICWAIKMGWRNFPVSSGSRLRKACGPPVELPMTRISTAIGARKWLGGALGPGRAAGVPEGLGGASRTPELAAELLLG